MDIYRVVNALKDKYTSQSKEIKETSSQRQINIDIEKELFGKIEEERDKIKEDNLRIRDRIRNQFYKLKIKFKQIKMRKVTRNILNLGVKIGKHDRERNKDLKEEKEKIINYLNEIINQYKEDEKMREKIKKMIRELEFRNVYDIDRIDMDIFDVELEYSEENENASKSNGSFIPKVKIKTPTNQFTVPNEVQEQGELVIGE